MSESVYPSSRTRRLQNRGRRNRKYASMIQSGKVIGIRASPSLLTNNLYTGDGRGAKKKRSRKMTNATSFVTFITDCPGQPRVTLYNTEYESRY